MSSVLVAMFDSQAQAAAARERLISAGFPSDAVTLTGAGSTTSSPQPPSSTQTSVREEPHHKGAIARFFDDLFGSNDDPDSVRSGYTDTYNEAFRRGSYGVSVRTAQDDEIDRAEQILNECGAVDIDEKSEQWRKEGWTGAALGGSAIGGGLAANERPSGATQKLQELEEELQVGKRAIARGGVRIFTRMTETPVEETVRLREEHAKIERTAVDRPATEADFAAFKEGSIEVREMAEEAVVAKTARVTGEVSVGKEVSEREEVVRDKVRKTQVEVEQLGEDRSGRALASDATSESAYGTTGSPHRDPLTGEPGSHPVGTAVGATAGGVAAGAAAGSVAGPVGTAVGAAVGAVAGGLAGKGAAEAVDPTTPKAKAKKPV